MPCLSLHTEGFYEPIGIESVRTAARHRIAGVTSEAARAITLPVVSKAYAPPARRENARDPSERTPG
jgi:hypothetical protein